MKPDRRIAAGKVEVRTGRFASVEQAAGYLAAMIDGEGHVQDGSTPKRRQIEIANTDPSIVEATQEACAMLGINLRTRWKRSKQPGRRPAAIMRIGAIDNLVRVDRLVPMCSLKKRAALKYQLAGYTRNKVLPLSEELVEMYAGGMSANQIAALHGVAHHAIKRRLLAAGVVLRSRGQANTARFASRTRLRVAS